MSAHLPVVAWVAYSLGAIPALWLGVRAIRAAEWWWLAAAFGISFLADTLALFGGNAHLASAVYPVGQAALIGVVFLPRPRAAFFLALLVGCGLLALLVAPIGSPDVLLHTVAWLGVVSIIAGLPLGRLRLALLIYFGLGWLAWLDYTWDPGWASWGLYQATRALGIGAFCWAAVKPGPSLRLETP